MRRARSAHHTSSGAGRKLLASLAVCGLLLAGFAGAASAAQTRVYTGLSFGPDGVGGSESFHHLKAIAVDPTDGSVYALDMAQTIFESSTLYKFDADGAPSTFSALGSNHIDAVGGTAQKAEVEIAVAPPSALGGTAGDIYVANNAAVKVYSAAGEALGELTGSEPCGVAVDAVGHVFVGEYPSTVREFTPAASPVVEGDQTAASTAALPEVCNVAVDGQGTIYGAGWNAAALARLDGIADPEATVVEPGGAPIAVDPATDDLYAGRADHVVVFDSALDPRYEFGAGQLGASYGVAVGAGDRAYVADGATGTIKVFGPALTIPVTEAATGVGTGAATLNGTLYPEGRRYTECRFEYGLTSAFGFERSADCEPPAAEIPAGAGSETVELGLTGLRPDRDYKFRLVATNSAGTLEGETLTFNTVGPPRATELLSRADKGSATVEATVDPRGAATSYRIEWGTTGSYGSVAGAGSVAAGEGPTRVTARLAGLEVGTAYHWRVVADSSEGGEAASPDQVVETPNSCGLTDHRCFELVSRADKGPLASPGKAFQSGAQIQFQAAASGSALAYTVPYGYPDATAGDATLYLARRGTGGWSSAQITPPALQPFIGLGSGNGSKFKVLSSSLGCGAVAAAAPLSPAAPTKAVEAGGFNLYVRDDVTGSYRLVTKLPPVGDIAANNFGGANEYDVVGMSPDCGRLVFRTQYRYPGIPAVPGSKFQLYEWAGGTLRNVAVVAGSGGPAEPLPAESIPGALGRRPESSVPLGGATRTDYWRAVSADASRSIFTAISRFGADSGRRAVFLRDARDPAVRAGTVPAADVSQSETATANDGNSRYWTASDDGRRIFFTARYGLATNGSSTGATSCVNAPEGESGEGGSGEGCDLYEYDLEAPAGERLTDLSPDVDDPQGAGVVGVLDASADGSYVYFAARGRLGTAGRTEAENLGAGTYNIYLAHAGEVHFVHFLGRAEAAFRGHALVSTSPAFLPWTSRASADGADFAFESSLGVPGGVAMVYLYDAADGATVCVSCRHDGRPPFAEHRLQAAILENTTNENRSVRPTVLTDNGRLYFYSFDPLAPGAVEGARNLYQWERGQVALIATEPPGVPTDRGVPISSFLGGASADGGDVYFATPRGLIGADRDERWDVYDARVGGGFPEPTPPGSPCDAAVEGACNSAGANSPGVAPPATSSFSGPGNPPTAKRRRKRRHHKKHHGHHKKEHQGRRRGKKHQKKAGKARRGNVDRRAAG